MSRYRRSRTAGASYFFTVTLADRHEALLTRHIDLLRNAYQDSARRRPFETIAICILPDHLHALWELPADDSDFSTRWAAIKSGFSHLLPPSPNPGASKQRKREKGIWQRRFWEHQIRDELDLQRHIDYIHYNPVKHGLVPSTADWPHSSFHRYVRKGLLAPDWGGSVEAAGDYGE
ncbi:transposase [Solimonas sp. K1W22B-7]|uniref:REP-associated tyrosine transposase n=1 Tax=Solimonas sp. K1W22B-7 TaxID=2303331 RepID=UPI000E3323B0|nr:transposase [Solimonas sp. K1W22B-7]AXQ28853.1 transposase [Solimonas sp. K1W22B-7]